VYKIIVNRLNVSLCIGGETALDKKGDRAGYFTKLSSLTLKAILKFAAASTPATLLTE
jgi:hypothetical protein